MTQQIHSPIEFLTVHKAPGGTTAPGAYLRWFVKPYLGLPGIAPMYPSGRNAEETASCGFQLFTTSELDAKPPLAILMLAPLLPEDQRARMNDIVTRPGWRSFLIQGHSRAVIDANLHQQFGHQVCYLRFNYGLCARQSMRLHYTIHNQVLGVDTDHDVDIHFVALSDHLEEGALEALSYAIHVDTAEETITSFSLTSNYSIVIGDIEYALNPPDLPFYIWTPAGGAGIWEEVPSNAQLLNTLNDPLIQPAPHRAVVDIMTEFYKHYYGKQPQGVRAHQQVSFEFPDLSALALINAPLREYNAEQYRELCEGDYEPAVTEARRFHLAPQDAASLASLDPAIAYLLGLFRVLTDDAFTERQRQFKIQGTWPDGQRYCVYSTYDPALHLLEPAMKPVRARAQKSTRVVRDYRTSRTHQRVNVADVSWPESNGGATQQSLHFGAVAYVVVAESHSQRSCLCKSPFYVPQEWEKSGLPVQMHYTDWLDYYTPHGYVHKVLDGDYTYSVAAFDVFGQLSGIQTDATHINPALLGPSQIQRPEIALSAMQSLQDSSIKERMDIPIEVTQTDTSCTLCDRNVDYLSFDYTFFWPLAARYVWDTNRATGQSSVDGFRLLYLADTPLSTDVLFDSLQHQSGGTRLELESVAESTTSAAPAVNAALFHQLKKLGAVNASNQLMPSVVKAALVGGSLVYQQAWEITDVSVSLTQQSLALTLIPASDAAREPPETKNKPFLFPLFQIFHTDKLSAQLSWNPEARFGGSRIGWQYLTSSGIKIQPAIPIQRNTTFVDANTLPGNPVNFPADLVDTTGLLATEAVPAQLPDTAVQHGFTIRLDADDELAQSDRFFFTPVDPSSTLQPGEYARSDAPTDDIEIPQSIQTLFSEERIVSFYAALVADDPNYPGKRIFRGDALPFRSTDKAYPDDLLLFPDTSHPAWIIVTPTQVDDVKVPLSELVGKGFNPDNYLTTSVVMGLEAVVTGKDPEVHTVLQGPTSSYKLSINRSMPAPTLSIQGAVPPDFGLAAGPPDYNGTSLIQIRSIFPDSDLDKKLTNSNQYILYALPADRVIDGGLGIEYAVDSNSRNTYRRNMAKLKSVLQSFHTNDPLSHDKLQELFANFSQAVHPKAMHKTDFLEQVVELPGESRTVFLYAIKAFDPSAKKESSTFTGLSKPVYVEDFSAPERPRLHYIDIALRTVRGSAGKARHNTLHIDMALPRQLSGKANYGYADALELTDAMLGANFPNLVARYHLYITTGFDHETLISPDDSDFMKIDSIDHLLGDPVAQPGYTPEKLQVKLTWKALNCQLIAPPDEPERIQLRTRLRFHRKVDMKQQPSTLYMCLRAENYLGQVSSLEFTPVTFRELA